MAVSRVKTSSILQGFPKSRSLLAGNTAYDPAATWLIQRQTAVGGETTITFSSIPQTYKHLQLRCIVKDSFTSSAGGGNNFNFRLNGDSGTNYIGHRLNANGTTVAASSQSASSSATQFISWEYFGNVSNVFGANIIDLIDYTNTSKYKTIKSINGFDTNGATAGYINLGSGLWMSTAAINSISITGFVSSCAAGSTFALYGMVG
jgi:hypothetical protein